MKSKTARLAYDLGSGNLKNHLGRDWNRIWKWVKGVSSFGAKVGFRCVYPILGNLSYDVQMKLENVVGKEYYDSNKATSVSYVTNMALYGSGFFSSMGATDEFSLLKKLGTSAFMGLACGAYEFNGREMTRGTHPVSRRQGVVRDPTPVASLPGKIVSFPLEAMIGVYDGIRVRRKRE